MMNFPQEVVADEVADVIAAAGKAALHDGAGEGGFGKCAGRGGHEIDFTGGQNELEDCREFSVLFARGWGSKRASRQTRRGSGAGCGFRGAGIWRCGCRRPRGALLPLLDQREDFGPKWLLSRAALAAERGQERMPVGDAEVKAAAGAVAFGAGSFHLIGMGGSLSLVVSGVGRCGNHRGKCQVESLALSPALSPPGEREKHLAAFGRGGCAWGGGCGCPLTPDGGRGRNS